MIHAQTHVQLVIKNYCTLSHTRQQKSNNPVPTQSGGQHGNLWTKTINNICNLLDIRNIFPIIVMINSVVFK